MTSVSREVTITAPAEKVWDALRDFGALHTRLVPGFVVMTTLSDDGRERVVTFFNGAVAREVLVGIDEDAMRVAYSVVESPMGATHHNASAQVFAVDGGASRFAWTTDVLPDALGEPTAMLMERGIAVIKATLGA